MGTDSILANIFEEGQDNDQPPGLILDKDYVPQVTAGPVDLCRPHLRVYGDSCEPECEIHRPQNLITPAAEHASTPRVPMSNPTIQPQHVTNTELPHLPDLLYSQSTPPPVPLSYSQAARHLLHTRHAFLTHP